MRALPESAALAITFPRLLGYKLEQGLRRIAQQWYRQQVDLVGEPDPRSKRLVRLQDPAAVAASVFLGIEAAALQAAAETDSPPVIVPLLNHHNPRGSTAYVHGSTTKEVFVTTKSHVNFVVADTDHWEQVAAKTFEQHAPVESYVKNAFLGFEVPYVDATGTKRRYLPDFILRVVTPGGERFHLVVEVTGFAKDKAHKRYFMRERWLPAVNAHRETLATLPWHFMEVTDIARIKEELCAEIDRLAAEVDERAEREAWRALQFEGLRKVWDNEHDAAWDNA